MQRSNSGNTDEVNSLYPEQYTDEKSLKDSVINQLEIPEALKSLLVENKINWDLLVTLDAAGLAKILTIDEYIAKLIIDSTKKKDKELRLFA